MCKLFLNKIEKKHLAQVVVCVYVFFNHLFTVDFYTYLIITFSKSISHSKSK